MFTFFQKFYNYFITTLKFESWNLGKFLITKQKK